VTMTASQFLSAVPLPLFSVKRILNADKKIRSLKTSKNYDIIYIQGEGKHRF
jgi:hypothetical protein